jgi:Zinc finger, C2H2 type
MYPTESDKEKHFQMVEPSWFGEERREERKDYPTDVLYSASLVQELSKYHENPYPDPYLLYDQHAHHQAMLHYNSLPYGLPQEELKLDTPTTTIRKKKKKKNSGIEDPVDCRECGKQFKNRSSLSSHKKIHLVGRNHVCTECSMAFSRSHGKSCRLRGTYRFLISAKDLYHT